MRTIALVLTLASIAPAALAAAASWTDPLGDEATVLGTRAGAKACRHGATDITRLDVEQQGNDLTVRLAVVNASEAWGCAGVSVPAHSGVQRVAFLNCGENCGPSLVLYRTWSTSATGETTTEQCFSVHDAVRMACRPSPTVDNTTIWSLQLRTYVYDLRSECFSTAFAESRTAPSIPQAGTLVETRDTLDIGPICL